MDTSSPQICLFVFGGLQGFWTRFSLKGYQHFPLDLDVSAGKGDTVSRDVAGWYN